jgi:hypothetical protein
MWALLTACFMLVSCLAYSSTLKMEMTCSSEASVGFQQPTQRYIPDVRTLHPNSWCLIYSSISQTIEEIKVLYSKGYTCLTANSVLHYSAAILLILSIITIFFRSLWGILNTRLINKKFREELITYSPLTTI